MLSIHSITKRGKLKHENLKFVEAYAQNYMAHN